MVVARLKSVDAALPVRTVRASRGKVARAEPVAVLYGKAGCFMPGFSRRGRTSGAGCSPMAATPGWGPPLKGPMPLCGG